MEDEALNLGLSTASTSYQSMAKSHLELCFDSEDGDDELKMTYPCPFCAEDFDMLELWCHIDLEHPTEAKSGICPVCALRLGMNMVEHITEQHGKILKSQDKSGQCKLEPYRTFSLSKQDLRDGNWQSFPAGSSPVISSSNTTRDPFLSFLYSAAAAHERGYVQPDSSGDVSMEEMHSDQADDCVLERDVRPSLSDKDQIENSRRSEFVQGLLMSTILDPDF